MKPPWGTLNAIDLNKGTIAWTVTLGELPELTQRGIPQTGTENYGGPIATAGGLLFIGATKDEKFRAFDRSTGRVLWETSLPAGGYATPGDLRRQRQAVRRHCGRRRKDGDEVGRRLRRLRVARSELTRPQCSRSSTTTAASPTDTCWRRGRRRSAVRQATT